MIKNRKTFLLLVLIVLLGTFLRFYNLGKESFWLDEGATALAVKKYGALGIIKNVYEEGQILPEYYPGYNDDLPFYYVFLSEWVKIFGLSEFSFRSFSAILGSFTLIWIFYLLNYLFNDKIALLSAFLASINLTLIWYSQETRQYTYLLFLSLISIIFLLKSLKEDKTKYIIGFIIFNALIIYSNFPWLIFIIFEGLFALFTIYKDYVKKRLLRKKVIIAFMIIGVLYIPLIGRALFTNTNTIDFYGRPSIIQIAKLGVQLSGWLYPSESMRQKIYDFSINFTLYEWILLLFVLLSALLFNSLFLIGILKSSYKKDFAIFLPLLFFFSTLFALIASLIHPIVTIFHIKLMLYIIPAYLMSISIGISKLKLEKILIPIVIILSIPPLHSYFTNVDKQQFREAAEFLPTTELIFLNIKSAQVPFKYYYGEKENVIGITDINDIKSHLNDVKSFWVLSTFTKYSDRENKIKKFLDENYRLEEKKEFFDIELFHYKKV